jgi:hypothetical protein
MDERNMYGINEIKTLGMRENILGSWDEDTLWMKRTS